MYIKCPECDGSIPTNTAICMDCGFDLAQYTNEVEAWFDEVDAEVPVEAYTETEHLFEHESHFYDHGDWAA